MLIQCMIERDGVTEVLRGGTTYRFERNKQGDAVCDVHNAGHAKMFLKMGANYYKEYVAPGSDPDGLDDMDLDGSGEVEDLGGDTFDESVPIVDGKDGDQQVAPGSGEDDIQDFADEPAPETEQEPDEPTAESAEEEAEAVEPEVELTEEEQTIKNMMDAGESYQTIADALGCSKATVGKRALALKAKLGIE